VSDAGLDLRAELARIDRDRAETHKLLREAEKFRAEEQKLWRDWQMAPWVLALSAVAALIGGLVARHL
jgi:hypothetical protein